MSLWQDTTRQCSLFHNGKSYAVAEDLLSSVYLYHKSLQLDHYQKLVSRAQVRKSCECNKAPGNPYSCRMRESSAIFSSEGG